MRSPRFILPPEAGVAAYHCLSRVLERKFVLNTNEKEIFVRIMRAHEAFCGVRVLTYCIMDNHFHILVEVPPRPQVRPSAEELFARQSLVFSGEQLQKHRDHYDRLLSEKRHQEADVMLEAIWQRMYDLSWFMHGVKGRFTQGYNVRHKRKGTLWEQRFRSVVVQSGKALQTMAAYIDLNPVRAGLVKKARDYRWCGYAEAVVGEKPAGQGIKRLMTMHEDEEVAKSVDMRRDILTPYGGLLYERGGKEDGEGAEEVSLGELMQKKIRWFTRGVIIGGQGFVNEVYQKLREQVGFRRESVHPKERGGEKIYTLR